MSARPEPTSSAGVDARANEAKDATTALHRAGIPGRSALLRALAAAFAANAEHLAVVADSETALGLPRLNGEALRTASQFALMADVLDEGSLLGVTIDRARPADHPAGPRPDLRRTSRSIGPVAVFAASNFPLAFGVAGTDTAAALAAGSGVVAKAHSLQPAVAEVSADIIRTVLAAHDLPVGGFSVIHGQESGRQLITHPLIKAGAFTGSLGGGRALWDLATARPDPIPFYGELGSVNPVVVLDGAARERGDALAQNLATALLQGNGQFCTQPGLILLPRTADGDRMLNALATRICEYPIATLLGTTIAATYARISAHRDALPTVLGTATGSAPEHGKDRGAAARLWEVSVDAALTTPELLEEQFGPSVVVVRFEHPDEAARLLESLPGCLTVSVHASEQDGAVAGELIEIAADHAGRILGGGVPTGVAVTWAQHHGGPWPATTMSGHTSVGAHSISRFLRPVVYQDVPHGFLPAELQDSNPLGVVRRVDGTLEATHAAIQAR